MSFRINKGIFQFKDGERFINKFKIDETGTMVEVEPETGEPIAAYMRTGDKASDSDLLDGINSSAFLRSNTADTASGRIDFTADESIRLKGIRGQFTNEYIHLYNKVGIGHPNGWGQGQTDTPNYGISTYGGANFAYGDGATSTFNGDIYVNQGRILIKRGTGLTHTEWEDDSTANGRAQLILDSHYSDLIIASRNANSNKHGSTLTFATQSTSTNDVAKWVIGQGQYQEGANHLAFAYSTNQTNPHSILGTDNANADFVIMDGGKVVIGGTVDKNAYNTTASTRLMFGGANSDAESHYYIGTNKEDYGGNYTKLDLRWHTGIRMGARPNYGGIRMYDSEDLGTVIFSVGQGDANVRVKNSLYILGSTNSGRLYSDEWGVKVGTDAGYIQFGPANTSWAHIYTDRAAFYTNKAIYENGARLATQSYAVDQKNAAIGHTDARIEDEIRPQITTAQTTADNAATAAAAAQATADTAEARANSAREDAAAAQATADGKLGATAKAADSDKLDGYDWMQSGKSVRANEFYADNWFRNYNSGEGLYNEATGVHIVSDASDRWTVRDAGNTMAIRFATNGDTQRGWVYSTSSNEIGFLDSDGNWAVRVVKDSHVEFRDDNEITFTVGQGGHSSNYGTVCTHGTGRGGWEGYSINGWWVFMSSDGANSGIYNDIDNEWMTRWYRNGGTELMHNGSTKLTTTSGGVTVAGTVTATAFSGDGSGLTGVPVADQRTPATINGEPAGAIISVNFNLDRGMIEFTLENGQVINGAIAR